MAQHFSRIAPACAVLPLALACTTAAGSELDGCWKMISSRVERQSGKVDTSRPACIRTYQDTTLVTSCRGGKDVSVYALADMNVSAYSYQQVARYVDGREARVEPSPARAAAFLVKGQALHMVLARGGAAKDPIVRTEQQLARLKDRECATLRRYLPQGGTGSGKKASGARS